MIGKDFIIGRKDGRKKCRASVTRLGDLLDFGQVLKPLAAINLPNSPTFLGNFLKNVSISIIFLAKYFLGNFYKHLAIFFWSHWSGHLESH